MSFDADLSHPVHVGRYGICKAVNSIQIFAPPVSLSEDSFDVIGRSRAGMIFNEGQFIFIIVNFIGIAGPRPDEALVALFARAIEGQECCQRIRQELRQFARCSQAVLKGRQDAGSPLGDRVQAIARRACFTKGFSNRS